MVVVALWLLVQGASLWALGSESPLVGGVVDPDSYLRLVKVRAWLDDGWYGAPLQRANWPYGDTPHWTRPLDLLIVALQAPLRLAGLPRDASLLYAGAAVSPLLHLALLLLVGWLLTPLLEPEARAFAPLVALAQPAVFTHAMVGRADHHGLIALAILLTAAGVLRALADPTRRDAAAWGGIAAGFGLWVSVETLLPLLLAQAALGLAYWRRGAAILPAGRDFAWAMLATIIVALAIERPPADWLSPELDRLSGVHAVLALIAAAGWGALGRLPPLGPRGRAVALLAVAIAAGLALWLVAPRFFLGPLADVDPRLGPIWLDGVAETQPLAQPGRLLAYLGAAVLALPYALKRAWREDTWGLIGLGLLAFVPLAIAQVRFADEAELMLVAPVAALAAQWRRAVPLLLRPLVVLGLTIGPLALGLALLARAPKTHAATAAHDCPLQPLAEFLNRRPPATILAAIDFGSELLWRTPHRVIGTPYHRNGRGILDTHHALSTSDDAAARRIMIERQVGLVLLCPSDAEAAFFDAGSGDAALYRRLVEGRGPAWLVPEPLPPEFAGFRLFKTK